MGVFSRFRDIVNANINAMLDRAEDPGKMVKMMIREMEDTLVELKASCAASMATKKKVQRELQFAENRAAEWGGKAELAVNKGREDLAREALLEKRRLTQQVESLGRELDEAQQVVEQYQSDIAQLEAKLGQARDKQRMLVERHRQAENRRRAQTDIRRFDNSEAFRRFEEFEQRIDRVEAEADLVNYGRTASIEEEFAELARDEEIERELAALKARRTPPASDTPV
ncbi:MAG: phage shock protein PspA [Candidatus Hydrogenedentota bacterium]